MTTFIRHRMGHERRTERLRFNPLPADHPLVGHSCWVCEQPLQEGQRPCLFAVGPHAVDDAQKADRGYWYNALALVGHESCWWPNPKDREP